MQSVTGVLFALLIALCLLAEPAAGLLDCPEPTKWGRCFGRYDKDQDNTLDLDEFKSAWGDLSFYIRWVMDSADHYFERCDIDSNGELTAWELLDPDCIGNCVKQWKVYDDLCT